MRRFFYQQRLANELFKRFNQTKNHLHSSYTSMRHIFRGLPASSQKVDCALAIGNFDGVHLGHQKLLRTVCEAAREKALASAVLTFEPHPREFFGSENVVRINTLRDKIEAIRACGIDRIFILPFNQHLCELSPEKFAQEILVDGLGCRWLTVGSNFRFGARRAGDFAALQKLGLSLGFEAHATPLVFHDSARVSSTRIRQAMQAGELDEVALMLGRPYCVTGRVIHGAALGRQLGFPTLNVAFGPAGSKSACGLHGSFAVRIKALQSDGSILGGVASMGFKPTVSTAGRWLLETHVFDWEGDAYGKIVQIEFVQKLRDEMKFSSLDELKRAIGRDAQNARRILGLPED